MNSILKWVAIKVIFLLLWIKIGIWLYSFNIGVFIAWAVLLAGLWALDFNRQIEISRCLKDIPRALPDGWRKDRVCRQLEAERTRLTFWWWLLKEMWNGWGAPKRIFSPCELMDDGPRWVRETIQKTLWLTEQKLFPFILKGFLPPLMAEIEKIADTRRVVKVLELGCGQCSLISKLAEECKKKRTPAVFVGLDIEPSAIRGAGRWLLKQGFSVRLYPERLSRENWAGLLGGAGIERAPIICLIRADVRELEKVFEPGISFDLVWMHHFAHHLSDILVQDLVIKIQNLAPKWYILEEFRSWLPLFLIHIFIWWFPCHLETAINSILANKTKQEWKEEFDGEITIGKKGFLAFISNKTE